MNLFGRASLRHGGDVRFIATFHHIFLLAMKVIVQKGFVCIKTIVLNFVYVYFLFLKDLVTLKTGLMAAHNLATILLFVCFFTVF